MSLRIDTAELIPGALVIGNTGLGVLGAAVPSTGEHGPGYLYNDLSLPADAGKEVRGLIEAWPSAGTLFAYEDSSFTFTGAPDGVYTFTYRLFVDGVDTGTATATITVGAGNVQPQAGSLTIAGHAPTVSQPVAASPAAGAVTITGHAPLVAQPIGVAPAVGSVSITGHAPVVSQSVAGAIVPAAGVLAIAGHAPGVAQSAFQLVAPDPGALVIIGHAPVVAQAGAQAITPQQGVLTITGHEPSVLIEAPGVYTRPPRAITLYRRRQAIGTILTHNDD